MFGYITANMNAMDADRITRYRSWYCGLCHALKERHGTVSRLTLNYDMTFLVMLLSSVYQCQPESESERCAAHPFRQHRYFCNDFSDYAADMNILLTYHNLMDDWQDDHNVISRCEAGLFKKAGQRAAAEHPRQSKAVLDGLDALAAAEANGELRPDIPADAFGGIMAELFAVYEDEHAPALRDFGRALGRFIYIMDACMDFDSDLRHMRYNPLTAMTHADFEPTLTMLAAECTASFDALPVTSDKDIMENILYTGMWAKYSMKYMKNKSDSQPAEPSAKEEPTENE